MTPVQLRAQVAGGQHFSFVALAPLGSSFRVVPFVSHPAERASCIIVIVVIIMASAIAESVICLDLDDSCENHAIIDLTYT